MKFNSPKIYNQISKKALTSFLCFLLCFPANVFAVTDRVRETSVSSKDDERHGNAICKTEKLSFDPSGRNPDVLWEVDNPTCIAFALSQGAALVSTQLAMNAACNYSNGVKLASDIKDVMAERASGRFVTYKALKRQLSGARSCAAYWAASNYGAAAICCSSLSAVLVANAIATAALSIIWQAAIDSQRNARICGEDWQRWQKVDASSEAGLGANYVSGTLPDNEMYVHIKNESYQKGLEDNIPPRNMESKRWREYMYGGEEYEDNDGPVFDKSRKAWAESETATRLAIQAQNTLTDCRITLPYKCQTPKNNVDNCVDDGSGSCNQVKASLAACEALPENNCDDEESNAATTQRASNIAVERARKQTDEDVKNSGGKDLVTEATLSKGCSLPDWSNDKLDKILGYHSGKQRYYMRGPNQAANYACGRFLLNRSSPKQEIESGKQAYECCLKRSQETMCIEETNSLNAAGSGPTQSTKTIHKFCKIGERCKVQNVWYEIAPAKKLSNYLCASTYSVCPYNHNLGGGTEIANYSSEHPDVLLNHCQYLKHCVKIPSKPYISVGNLDGAWISAACRDLKGDSQNQYEFNGSLTPINNLKNFSAPMAQCFKETLENVFTNTAGTTKCIDPNEEPDANKQCSSGYQYKTGDIVAGKSFFQKIQEGLQDAIKLIMTLVVVILGFTIFLTGKMLDKKSILMFLVKIGLVSYFALGNAWQDKFFSGVSNASMYLSNIFMRLDVDVAANKKDGCQFPKYNYTDLTNVNGQKFINPSYPSGKEYLAIWDTLDCKIIRALGFGPEVSVPNLFMMILAGFLTNGLGIIFFVATFIFAFYLIALTVRALHIFLISATAIVLMIYVSPITITAALFKRTNGIFTGWRNNLLSYVLQPVILFAYLGVLITIFDQTMMGDATFSGDGINMPKTINCSVGEAKNNSIYCIFRIADIKTNNALAPIGVGLPFLFEMNQQKLNTIFKAAFLMFIFTQFLDKITGLGARLTGGAALESNTMSAMAGMAKAYGAVSAVQSRGKNALQKWGGKAAYGAGSKVKSIARSVGNRGKSVSGPAEGPKDDNKLSG